MSKISQTYLVGFREQFGEALEEKTDPAVRWSGEKQIHVIAVSAELAQYLHDEVADAQSVRVR